MAWQVITEEGINFWDDPYVKPLTPYARLALMYAESFVREGKPVILEDMVRSTKLEYTETRNYLQQFVHDGRIPAGSVEGQL